MKSPCPVTMHRAPRCNNSFRAVINVTSSSTMVFFRIYQVIKMIFLVRQGKAKEDRTSPFNEVYWNWVSDQSRSYRYSFSFEARTGRHSFNNTRMSRLWRLQAHQNLSSRMWLDSSRNDKKGSRRCDGSIVFSVSQSGRVSFDDGWCWREKWSCAISDAIRHLHWAV